MKGIRIIAILSVILVAMLIPMVAQATPIYVTELTGARFTPNDIITTDGWTEGGGGFKISWVISEVSPGIWNYKYTFTDKDGTALEPDLSHFLLEVSPSFTSANIWGANGRIEAPKSYDPSDTGSDNPDLPGVIYAVKFDFGSDYDNGIFSFTSNRVPVWGDFYVKDGDHLDPSNPDDGKVPAIAYNAGFGTDPGPYGNGNAQEPDFGYWVPTPDTTETPPIPEPGTLILLGSGLVGIAGYGAIRRKKKS